MNRGSIARREIDGIMKRIRLWANFDGTGANVTPLSAIIGVFVREGQLSG